MRTTHFSRTVHHGKDGTGREVKLFGDTSGAYALWDKANDRFKLMGGASIHILEQCVQAFKAEYNITAQQGAWVHGVKVELTRAADIQPATGCWFGAQFVLNAGSAGYAALNKPAYALQAVFKGSDTNPDGTDIHVGRFEIQSAGKVSDIVHILANTGCSIIGSMLYLAAHINTKAILINVQSNATISRGLDFLAGAGSTITSLIHCAGAGTFTNLLECGTGATFCLEDNKAAPTKAGSLQIKTPTGGTAWINFYDGSRA